MTKNRLKPAVRILDQDCRNRDIIQCCRPLGLFRRINACTGILSGKTMVNSSSIGWDIILKAQRVDFLCKVL